MTARIIDGKAMAAQVRAEVASHTADMKKFWDVMPGLAVVLVGDNPASQVYVRNKIRACEKTGIQSYNERLPDTATQEQLLELIAELNGNPQVHGILVQLPLPAHINANAVINAIDPLKDVDGFHPVNVGRLTAGMMSLAPCTPQGCMMMLREVIPDLRGQKALVIGRSNIVGKPVALMLLQADCTVTIAHSKTRDLPAECREADILIAAVGQPEMIRGDWIKPGAVVIDVGINRGVPDTGGTKLIGDVAFAEAVERAGAISPVPGGVGPMTIACLLQNTLQATMMQTGWA
ncbi:MAG: bifunctional methylenetetrahydrofolate dehydrogenase/methenyltetrahydrofolate cyclohydrolase FolD [Alphaproteobacteria bacterium]|nr:bifunctional methylenetetrahydrofolate dehydrogenase/methenyltetrahydrofolate cyclohydrolase FolD [Alphaproteobacteria bacterium]